MLFLWLWISGNDRLVDLLLNTFYVAIDTQTYEEARYYVLNPCWLQIVNFLTDTHVCFTATIHIIDYKVLTA